MKNNNSQEFAVPGNIIAITPLENPDPRLALSIAKTPAQAVMDFGRDHQQGLEHLQWLLKQCDIFGTSVGLRIPEAIRIEQHEAPLEALDFIILDSSLHLEHYASICPVIAQVVNVEEAQEALALGATGIIAKGSESGGRIGDESSFILIQRLLRLKQERLAQGFLLYAQGGIGLHTGAAVIAAGADGIVLDNQLTYLPESQIPSEIKSAIAAMDGSETKVINNHRFYTRPGLAIAKLETISDQALFENIGAESLEDNFIPVGMDACIAATLSKHAYNLPDLIFTFQQAISGHLRQASALQSFAAESPLAKSLGTQYPIAQGPMTRVSDTAEFAAAVSDNGAMPYLALSLMTAESARELVEKTHQQISDKPWGIGVLGFAPKEILEPHLELIKEYRPASVLIAGGRPSQARALEELGITTFLHVPAPGLLKQFLKDGARNFVFEGRECGGHIGPRMSFPLWEQQLDVLLEFDQPETLQLFFAGGIHDSCSAAMVATLAAPLAAKGARIGLLMGTAYTTTPEAVESGAVLPQFQQQVICQQETATLETAPGHEVRCLNTAFVDEFHNQKQQLSQEQDDPKAIWQALEMLNVGRLRIATKGVVRNGDALETVSATQQLTDGMYMIGQLSVMRNETISMRDLHEDVTTGAMELLQTNPQSTTDATPQANDNRCDIAVVGMASILPGADDLEGFWANILSGHDAVTEVPAERWNIEQNYDPNAPAGQKSASKWGGFLNDIPFDPLEYGIPPQSLAAIEPVQLLSLEACKQALSDAGYQDRAFDRERCSVIFGAEAGMDLASGYGFRNTYENLLGDIPAELDAVLPSLTEDSFPGVLVNVISGRIANRLDLGGVNYSVDAACASSLAAVEIATKELRSGTSDMVLAGGADFHNSINDYKMFSSVQALSKTGRCKSFDSEADGIALGEGVGVVVLKRLEDAQLDGDRVYAVIKGIAGSSDGKSLGLTAPRKEGQKRALTRAYRQAKISAADIQLVEAHGTGTVVGDRTEMQTLTEIFNQAGALAGSSVLGSVKTQIGHTKCAAGLAGFIKAAKAIYHKTLPPTQQITRPNPFYNSATSPFNLNSTPQPWVADKRLAAISAFGFGGTNFHAVLEQAPEWSSDTEHGSHQWPCELFIFRGENSNAVKASLNALSTYLSGDKPLRLRDLAHSVYQQQPQELPAQIAFVAKDKNHLQQLVNSALNAEQHPEIHQASKQTDGKVALLFPGQGSQRPGMMNDLFCAFPELQPLLKTAQPWLPVLFPPTRYEREQQREQLKRITDTRNAQPTLGITGLAMFTLLKKLGIRGDMAAGHSYGELVALSAAGVISAEQLLPLSQRRGERILEAAGDDPGKMAAVSSTLADLEPLLTAMPNLVAANQNAPKQTVIAGPSEAIEEALIQLEQQGIAAREIPVACAFHSPVVASAAEQFADDLKQNTVNACNSNPDDLIVYSNTLAAPYPKTPEDIRSLLAQHIAQPVRFVDQIKAMYKDGARTFIEVGTGRVLTGLVDKILSDQDHQSIATYEPNHCGVTGLLTAVAQIACAGVSCDINGLFSGRETQRLDLSEPAPNLSATTWLVNGHRSRPLRGEPPKHAGKVLLKPLAIHKQTATMAAPVANDSMALYLQSVREMVQAQRDIMLGMLGNPAATTLAAPQPLQAIDQTIVASPALTPAAEPQAKSAPAAMDIQAVLLSVVSERTGYPSDMLDLELDLEADLSIDSIKRMEIIGELADTLGLSSLLGDDRDELTEQLASLKTLSAILHWLKQKLPQQVEAEQTPATATVDTKATLLSVVSERTGYPADMLDLDLDLEADLSIDSIKRMEIIGELAESLGLSALLGEDRDHLTEQLATLKTLNGILGWLKQQMPEQAQSGIEKAAAAAIDVIEVLLQAVSERTGYPIDMLDLDLDLEADLSIDSIKRMEIIGELAVKLAMPALAIDGDNKDAIIEQLAAKKTLRAISDWLQEENQPSGSPIIESPQSDIAEQAQEKIIPLYRYIFKPKDQPLTLLASNEHLHNKSFVITDDGRGIAHALAKKLIDKGAKVEIVEFKSPTGTEKFDGLIHLAGLSKTHQLDDLTTLFEWAQRCNDDTDYLLVAGGLGGLFGHDANDATSSDKSYILGGGIGGFIKSFAKEHPATQTQWIDLDLSENSDDLATYLQQELMAEKAPNEVGYHQGQRYTLEIIASNLPDSTEDKLKLTRDSVVLITGGARGVAASLAIEFAKRYQCQLELVGRSPMPEPEPASTQDLADHASLRRYFIDSPETLKPAEIEQRCQRILNDRAMRETIYRITKSGGRVNYHALDVRDKESFATLIDKIYERNGRIDGAIHAAGILEDKLVRHKTVDSFKRVFDTKVAGAITLAEKVRDDIGFLLFFSSVAGAFGNRGQIDYASGNDALDKIAHNLSPRLNGRVLSINWGPWGDTGMVTPELKRNYDQQGIGLIPLQIGIDAMINELRHGQSSDSQVVLMCADIEAMA